MMKSKENENKVVYAIFKSEVTLDKAVEQLRLQGFRPNDISVLMPRSGDTSIFAHEKGTKAPEGTTAGAATGALAGGALGWLVGIGSLAIPGAGPFIAAGPIVAAVAGMGIGGAVGGIAGALIGLGIPEYEAKRYEGYVNDGGILLSVHADNSSWVEKAKSVLNSTGADNVSSTTESSTPEPKKRSTKSEEPYSSDYSSPNF